MKSLFWILILNHCPRHSVVEMIQDTMEFVETLCCQRNFVGEAGISQTGLVDGLEHDFYILLWLSIQLGISESQLTNSMIFQRAWSTTNQRDLNRGNDDKASNLWRYPLFKQTKNCCLELLVSCGKSLLLCWCGEKGVFVISLPQWTESTIFFGFCLSWFFSGFKIQWTQFNWVSKFRVPKNVMIGNHIRLGKGLKQKRLKKL